MKNIRILFSIFMTVLSLTATAANENGTAVNKADSAYEAGNYREAARLYEQYKDANGISAPLLYNLGNAYYQDGDYGMAMLNWELARRLDPGNKDINANINYLRSKVEDANKAEQRGKRLKVAEDEPSFFQGLYRTIAQNTASDSWAVAGGICFLLFTVCVALYIFSGNVMVRKTGFFGGLGALVLAVVFTSFAFWAAKAAVSGEDGVVTAFKVSLTTEPGAKTDASAGPVLTKGTKVRIVSEETDALGNVTWFKVRLNSDYIGWVSAQDMVRISLGQD